MKNETLKQIENFFKKYPQLAYLRKQAESAINAVVKVKKHEGSVLVCGNGGSSADSQHISGELLKSFCLKRSIGEDFKNKLCEFEGGEAIAKQLQQGVKCLPLCAFTSFSTAFANDCDGEYAFAQLVNVLGGQNDLLICISTSGNSKNILHAAKVAKAKNLPVVGLTGETGGKLKPFCDILLNVPAQSAYEVQEYHLPVYHLICLCAETELFV